MLNRIWKPSLHLGLMALMSAGLVLGLETLRFPQAAVLAQNTESRLEDPSAQTPLYTFHGTLSAESDTLTDGSFYNLHTFTGEEGQLLLIDMVSDEFDAYLILLDPEGDRIAENDDGGVGTNAQIALQLPVSGEYTLIANSYQAEETGAYVITLRPTTEGVIQQAEQGDKQLEAALLLQVGIQQYQMGQFQESQQSWEAALAIYQALGDRQGESNILAALGMTAMNLGQLQDAIALSEQALMINRDLDNVAAAGLVLNTLGNSHRLLGQYSEAMTYYEQALQLAMATGDRGGEGSALNGFGNLAGDVGQYAEALQLYEQALGIMQEIGNRLDEGAILNNIGDVYRNLGQYPEATHYHEQALSLAREMGDRQGEANALLSLGNVSEHRGQYQESLQFYEQALTIMQGIGNRMNEGLVLNNIGNIYRNLGQYQDSLNVHEQAVVIAREVGDRNGEGNAIGNLGNIHAMLGQYPMAIALYEESIAIKRETGDRATEAILLNNLGVIHRYLEEYERSLSFFEQSLAIAREIGRPETEGFALGNLGIVQGKLGNAAQAIALHEEHLALAQQTGNRAQEGWAFNNLGEVYAQSEQSPQAMAHYQQSLSIFQEIGSRAEEAMALSSIGRLLAQQDQRELAVIFYKQSVNVREAIRNDIRGLSLEQQQAFTETIASDYRELADLLLQQDRVLEAQRVLDLLKVQELDDYLQSVRGTAQTETGIDLLAPEATFTNRAIAIGRELAELRRIPGDQLTSEQIQRIRELDDAQRLIIDDFLDFIESEEVQALIADLSRDVSRQDLLTELDQLITLQNNLRDLDQNAVLLYPLILEDRLELVLVTPFSEPTRYPVTVDRATLNAAIVSFRQALDDPTSDPRPIAQQLYTWLIEPLAADLDAIGTETLIYSPDGVLRYVPLAALYDGEQWLTQRFRVNHITAASLQNFNLRPSSQPQILAAAFSEGLFPVLVGDRQVPFSGLPFAGREVENLAAMFPGTTKVLNEAFNPDDTVPIMDNYTIVHLATHAAFVPGAPVDSFILFGNGDRITLEEIKRWRGRFNRVELVVLSACETGVSGPDLGNGEEILGFGYLMQEAGANAAIASLWSVSDGGTQALMDAFYSALQQGMSKVEALQQAQIALITGDLTVVGMDQRAGLEFSRVYSDLPTAVTNNLSHPYYWAPFILIGNGL